MALVVLGRYLMIFKECVKCSGEKHQQHTSNNHDTSNNKEKGNKFQKKKRRNMQIDGEISIS